MLAKRYVILRRVTNIADKGAKASMVPFFSAMQCPFPYPCSEASGTWIIAALHHFYDAYRGLSRPVTVGSRMQPGESSMRFETPPHGKRMNDFPFVRLRCDDLAAAGPSPQQG